MSVSRLAGIALVPVVVTSACFANERRDEAVELFAPIPDAIPVVDGNPVTPEKIELGKALFFDPRISASGVFSCNSCHNLATGGDDNMPTSIGHGWQKGPRNAPTVLNAVFNQAQFWDGRAEDLKEQAKGPVQAGIEMANTPDNVVATLKSMPQYVDWFSASFPGADDPVTFDNFARAIEAYEVTLTTPAPFDAWIKGDDTALTPEQLEGFGLFIDNGCGSCHGGVNFGGQDYYPFGLSEAPGEELRPAGDLGRFSLTLEENDEYAFRAAPLRNVALTAPYFHSGKVWDLKDAVQIMSQSQLGDVMPDADADKIVAFLQSLTGELAPVVLPVLPAETAATPRPSGEVD